jgi:general secretion pathway protein J
MRQALRCQLGFTLIEVLIAMTLLSVMVVLLFSSLKICAQSWEQGENKITDVNEVAVVYNFFQRHLSSATPLWNDFVGMDGKSKSDTNADDEEKLFSFQGKQQSLQFVSTFPASAGRSGLQLFSIQPQEQDGDQVIKVSLTPFFPVAEGESWHQEEVVLLKQVSHFSLSYFVINEDVTESMWQDEWLDKSVHPQLVKINIGTTNGVYWPEMVIALKVAEVVDNDELEPDADNTDDPAEVQE